MATLTLEQRLQMLEQQNFRWKVASLGLLGLLSVMLVLGASESQPSASQPNTLASQYVKAEEFQVVDPVGVIRARLRLMELFEPGLIMYDDNGIQRACLYMHEGAPALMFYDENRRPRVNLTNSPRGPRLEMCDDRGRRRAVLAVEKGRPSLMFLDEDERPFWSAPR